MSKVPYTKPALTYAAQIQQLKDRGLIIVNEPKASHLLEVISYYRLSGYWYPMLIDKQNHKFKPGSTFENAFKLYCFDRELRKLILSELEKIEVAVRAKMIYNLWHKHGAFWFKQSSIFTNVNTMNSTILKLEEEFNRSDEEFIKAFKRHYTDPLPPACMILEISSFGNLSSIYYNLKPGLDKREISNYFGIDDSTFESWLHSFTYVRNVCAHHSRLWNKRMGISPKLPLTPTKLFLTNTTLPNRIVGQPPVLNNNSSYFILSMIIYLLNTINPKHNFQLKLSNLLKAYPMVDVKAMGFPENWKSEPLWNWDKGTKIKWWQKIFFYANKIH